MTGRILSGFTLACCCAVGGPQAGPRDRAVDDWQRQRLFNPSPTVIRQEQQGQIFIYEEMLESDIEKALQTQFDRVDKMMFIRTIPTDETGQAERDEDTGQLIFEDDGC